MKILIYYLNIGKNFDLVEKSLWTLRNIAKYNGDVCVLSDKKIVANTIDISKCIIKNYNKSEIERYQIFQMKYVIDDFVDINKYDYIIYTDTDVIFKDEIDSVLKYIESSNNSIICQENVFGSFRSHVDATDHFKIVKDKYSHIVDSLDGKKHLCAGFFCIKRNKYDFFKGMRDLIKSTDKKIDDQSALNILCYMYGKDNYDIFPRDIVYFNNASSAPVQHCCDKGAISRFFNFKSEYSEFS